jgi:glycosyltransferase involved in cell wall biosynthesis
MVTVIIPATTKKPPSGKSSKSKHSHIGEIIVIDDKSADNTVEEARKEGVKIFTSTVPGKVPQCGKVSCGEVRNHSFY